MSITAKLEALREAYSEEELEPVLDRLLQTRLEAYRNRLSEYEYDLQAFEERYKVKSADLYEQFEAGQRGDAADYLEWLGVYDHYLRLRHKIERIEQALPGD